MRVTGVEGEMDRRRQIIKEILKKDIDTNIRGNEAIKYVIEQNYSNIKSLFDNVRELDEISKDFTADMLDKKVATILYESIGQNFNEAKGEKLRNITQEFFLKIFTPKRSIALVNILQPKNKTAYRKEDIESLQFEKSEILEGFKEKNVRNEYLAEIQVNTLFWINKLTKLINYAEINKLKAKPFTRNSDDNYLHAKMRTDILILLDELSEKDALILVNEFSDDYEKKFGVKITEDLEMIKDINNAKASLYAAKNMIVSDLLVRYFKSERNGKDIPGIQGMGIKRNDTSADDRVNSYVAVIRMKGYSSNVYLHVPYYCYESTVALGRADGLRIKVPNVTYSNSEPKKCIPVNVICKIDKKSKRYAEIKREAESKKDNLILRQALSQIKGTNLAAHSKAKWDSCTIHEQEEEKMELPSEEFVERLLFGGHEWWEY